MRKMRFALAGFLLGATVALAAVAAVVLWRNCMGAPRVTVVNATGGDITNVAIHLGSALRMAPDLKDGHAATVRVSGRFGEASTRVTWTGAAGAHDATAGDYVENYGFVRAHVVLMPDSSAKAYYVVLEE